jgi:hypothetical protein
LDARSAQVRTTNTEDGKVLRLLGFTDLARRWK